MSQCRDCGEIIHTGRAMVGMMFTPDELEGLAYSHPDREVRRRAICALGLLDEERADLITAELRAGGLW